MPVGFGFADDDFSSVLLAIDGDNSVDILEVNRLELL